MSALAIIAIALAAAVISTAVSIFIGKAIALGDRDPIDEHLDTDGEG